MRIRGIDAPEMHSKCERVRRAALDARHALEEPTTPSGRIKLTRIAGDKYFGRILADVTLDNGRNPAQDLISTGHPEGMTVEGNRRRSAPLPNEGRSGDRSGLVKNYNVIGQAASALF